MAEAAEVLAIDRLAVVEPFFSQPHVGGAFGVEARAPGEVLSVLVGLAVADVCATLGSELVGPFLGVPGEARRVLQGRGADGGARVVVDSQEGFDGGIEALV